VLALLEVCKIPSPSGFLVAPGAELDSGALHAWSFGGGSLPSFLWKAARAGLRAGAAIATASAARRVAVAPEAQLAVHLNGDYVGTTPATFEVLPRAALVAAPDTLAPIALELKAHPPLHAFYTHIGSPGRPALQREAGAPLMNIS
jgi:diacylglycerol kinase family enzyme